MSSRCKKIKIFQELYLPEPTPELRQDPVEEFTALWDPHMHFTTFENSIFFKKQTLVKLLGSLIPDIFIYRYNLCQEKTPRVYSCLTQFFSWSQTSYLEKKVSLTVFRHKFYQKFCLWCTFSVSQSWIIWKSSFELNTSKEIRVQQDYLL